MKLVSCLTLLMLAQPAFAAEWTLVPEESNVTFSGTHVGRQFEGTFTELEGTITFDPEALDSAKASICVPVASAETGNDTYDGTLPESDWLDAEQQPIATWEGTKFEQDDRGVYAVTGTLSLAGQQMPVLLQGPITIEGDRATFDAKTVVNRMDFGIGEESDPKGEYVSLQIPLVIHAVAVKQDGKTATEDTK